MSLKVAVAMSGGIDSSMCAKMLVDAGYKVHGIYLKLHNNGEVHSQNIANVGRVARYLGISYEILSLTDSFQRVVVEPFVDQYKSGVTPNPCTICNREIKFGALFSLALERGYEKIATGHYVRSDGEFFYEAVDKTKDQSYFLFNVKREVLPNLLFPLGSRYKSELKKEATEIAEFAPLLKQKESSEICFVEENYIKTLKELGVDTDVAGIVVDESGKKVGSHKGYMHYTIGQRRGFDVPLSHIPLYVKAIDPLKNQIVVCPNEDIYESRFTVKNLNLFTDKREFECSVKVRYRSLKSDAFVKIDGKCAVVTLKKPQFAIAKGQAAVFYDGDKVLGGGYIS